MAPLVWLVTGCSSGIGRVFAQQILARGDQVIATARRIEAIQDLKELGASIIALDVTRPQQEVNEIVAKVISVHGGIDVLVNNAAYVGLGALEDVSDEELRAQFDTNVFGVANVTRAVLPHFRQRRAGHLVYLSSMAGWKAYGFDGPYAASKFALEGLVESISIETAPIGIKTLLVEPGFFRTKLLTTRNRKGLKSTIPEYVEGSAAQIDGVTAISENQPGDPERLVAIIMDVVRGEGVAAGRDIPLRLPLGADALQVIKTECESMLTVMEEWEEVISSTDFQKP